LTTLFKNFCINPLVAIVQKTKFRPILNFKVSVGSAFNEAVDENKIRKLTMCSAKIFSQTLLKAGKNAKFCINDMADAFKLIPSHKNDWKFFSFKWLGKVFTDATNPFGSKVAPANFDNLGETIVNIVKTISNTPSVLVHRQLDDVPVVSPESSNDAETFFRNFKFICKSFNVKLAPDWPNFEKVFSPSTHGKVLGINLNSKNLSWNLPYEKQKDTLSRIQKILDSENCNL
jgi:hypothetical protein